MEEAMALLKEHPELNVSEIASRLANVQFVHVAHFYIYPFCR